MLKALDTGILVDFSVQQILSCSKKDDNCDGAYFLALGAILAPRPSQTDVPYPMHYCWVTSAATAAAPHTPQSISHADAYCILLPHNQMMTITITGTRWNMLPTQTPTLTPSVLHVH